MAMRKKLLINGMQQSRFIITVLLVCLLIMIINAVNIYVLFKHFAMAQAGPEEMETLGKVFASIFQKMKARILLLVVVNGIVVIGLGLFLSHRIAGPSFNIEREMRQVMDGDISGRVKLRDGDQLLEVASSMNMMLEGLRDIVGDIGSQAGRLEKAIAGAGISNPEIQRTLEGLRRSLARFRLPESVSQEQDSSGEKEV